MVWETKRHHQPDDFLNFCGWKTRPHASRNLGTTTAQRFLNIINVVKPVINHPITSTKIKQPWLGAITSHPNKERLQAPVNLTFGWWPVVTIFASWTKEAPSRHPSSISEITRPSCVPKKYWKAPITGFPSCQCREFLLISHQALLFVRKVPFCLLIISHHCQHCYCFTCHHNWLVVSTDPSEKYESQIGVLFPIYIYIYTESHKIHVPKHQAVMVVYHFLVVYPIYLILAGITNQTLYPLVNSHITMERSTIFNGKIPWKSTVSMAMFNSPSAPAEVWIWPVDKSIEWQGLSRSSS